MIADITEQLFLFAQLHAMKESAYISYKTLNDS